MINSLSAGSFYSEEPVYYDNDNCYIGIKPKIESGFFSKSKKITYYISNYLIYNTLSKSNKYIFLPDENRHITNLIFEKIYDQSKKKIIFNINAVDSYSGIKILNNDNVQPRKTLNYLLFVQTIEMSKIEPDVIELWIADKNGNNLKKIRRLLKNESWHIDVKNQKLIIIKQDYLKSKVIEYLLK